MNSIKFELNPLQKQSKYQPYIVFASVVIYLFIGVVYLTKSDNSGYIWILSSIIFIASYYYQKIYSSKYCLEINNNFVQVKQSMFDKNNIKIDWSIIDSIHIKPITIEFYLKNKDKKEVSLANTTYKNVLGIKTKMQEFAKEKGVEIN